MNKRITKIILFAVLGVILLLLIAAHFVIKQKSPAAQALETPSNVPPTSVWEDGQDDTAYTPIEEIELDEESIGILSIEKIEVSVQVFDSGNAMEDMLKGASHYRSSSYWDGNVCFAAHIGNAGYSYFDRLHELALGDVITYQTSLGTRQYAVTTIVEIAETDWSYLGETRDNRVTLTTCIPGQPELRLCVQAVEIL